MQIKREREGGRALVQYAFSTKVNTAVKHIADVVCVCVCVYTLCVSADIVISYVQY